MTNIYEHYQGLSLAIKNTESPKKVTQNSHLHKWEFAFLLESLERETWLSQDLLKLKLNHLRWDLFVFHLFAEHISRPVSVYILVRILIYVEFLHLGIFKVLKPLGLFAH